MIHVPAHARPQCTLCITSITRYYIVLQVFTGTPWYAVVLTVSHGTVWYCMIWYSMACALMTLYCKVLHGICMVLNGIDCTVYSMALHGICMVLNGIHWYSMVLSAITMSWDSMVFCGTIWHCTILSGTA